MTYYYDSIIPTAKVSSNLDPATEVATFLSTKWKEWCDLVGPDYAIFRYGHEDWVDTSSMSQLHNILVEFISPAQRAGLSSPGDHIYYYLSFNIYAYEYAAQLWTPGTSSNGFGSVARTGSIYTSGERYDYTSTYANGYELCVYYSDTPGNRYFSWSFFNYRPTATTFMEIQAPSDKVPDRASAGWCVNTNTRKLFPLSPVMYNSEQLRIDKWMMPSVASNSAPWRELESGYLSNNLPVYANSGAFLGHLGDTCLGMDTTSWVDPDRTVTVDGKEYTKIKNSHILLRTK